MAPVTCARCGQSGEQLPRPPLGGTRGQVIQERTCAACWSEWLQTSANLINHYGLQVAVPADRQQLYVVMAEFLKLPAVAPTQPVEGPVLADPTVEGGAPPAAQ